MEWRKNGRSFRSCPQTERLSPTEFRCTTKFTPLSYRSDNGTYSCAAILSPRAQYTYLRTQTGASSSIPLRVAGQYYSSRLLTDYIVVCLKHILIYIGSLPTVPVVTVTMTTNTTRILDVSPYNMFSATCSATVEVTGLEGRVQLRRRWQWKRRGVGSGSFQPVSDMLHTDSGSVSVLSMSETTSGSVGYRCRCDLEGTDNIHDTEEVIVSVISEYPNKAIFISCTCHNSSHSSLSGGRVLSFLSSYPQCVSLQPVHCDLHCQN